MGLFYGRITICTVTYHYITAVELLYVSLRVMKIYFYVLNSYIFIKKLKHSIVHLNNANQTAVKNKLKGALKKLQLVWYKDNKVILFHPKTISFQHRKKNFTCCAKHFEQHSKHPPNNLQP